MNFRSRRSIITPRTIFMFSVIAAATGCGTLLGDFEVGSAPAGADGGPDALTDSPSSDAPVTGDGGGDASDAADAGCKVTSGGVLLDDVTAVAAGGNHTCAIRQDGALYCWGDNGFGQLGVPQTIALSSGKPVKVIFPGLGSATIREVAVTENTSFAIDSQLHLWVWGNNESGLLAIGSRDSNPHDVPAMVKVGAAPLLVRKIAPEWFSACALTTTSDVMCWGPNQFGELGTIQPAGVESTVPVKAFANVGVAGPNAILAPGIGSQQTCFATGPATDGMRCWGGKFGGLLLADLGAPPPNGGVNYSALSTLVTAGAKPPLAQVAYGTNFGAALDSVGRAFTWGVNNSSGQHGTSAPAAGTAQGIPGSWTSIAAGYVQVCAISDLRRLHCRGSNTQGQLGRDTSAAGSNAAMDPVVTGIAPNDKPLEKVSEVSTGFFHTCAIVAGACGIKGPGQLKCWGEGTKGQLGDDRNVASTLPVDVKAP